MKFRVLTLRYSPEHGVIDDAPLLALDREHEVLGVREHFFTVHDVPHLLCLVNCQPRNAQTMSAPPTATAVVAAATPTETPTTSTSNEELSAEQQRLFEAIRAWRKQTAHRDGLPAYVVLTNRNIHALVKELPQNPTDMARIKGIGKAKVERYGDALLRLLHDLPTTEPETTEPETTEPETPIHDPDHAPRPS